MHVFGSASGGVKGERARVRKTVEHATSAGDVGHSAAVVFLIEEEAGFLAVFEIDMVAHAVFDDFGRSGAECRCGFVVWREGHGHRRKRRLGAEAGKIASQGEPSAAFLKAFELARRHVIALVNAANDDAIFGEHLYKQGEHDRFQALHAVGERLGHKHVVEAVDDEAAKAIGLGENHAAGGNVVAHHGAAMVPCPANFAFPKRRIERVVRVGRKQANANLALLRENARAKVCPFACEHVDEGAVFRGDSAGFDRFFPRAGCFFGVTRFYDALDFRIVDPGVAGAACAFAFGRDECHRVGTVGFHGFSLVGACLAAWAASQVIPGHYTLRWGGAEQRGRITVTEIRLRWGEDTHLASGDGKECP